MGVDAEVIKVEDFDKILGYGVMVTPALVIDGDVKVAGRVPSVDDIKKWIKK
jgi:small redox-active disulfide protein 2